ncbi:MAG: helix-turn-helix domain-containing protein [Halodesulfurarchaeum sp.]|nr:helix-turn-helix domain-containing protein [Halodesulfurarchaeum sp.]
MPQATLTITIPDTLWIGAITRDYPNAEFRILSAVSGDETGVGLVEITGAKVDEVLSAFESVPETRELNVLGRENQTGLVQFETTEPTLLFPIVGSGIPLEMPFELQNGEAIWEITTSQERLSQLGEELSAFQIQYTVEEIRYTLETETLLTDRQLSLIKTASDAGYYDSPRNATLTEVADAADIAKSTCSETLQRAEGKIIGEFLSDEESMSEFQ